MMKIYKTIIVIYVNELSNCFTAVISKAVDDATSRAQLINCFFRFTFDVRSDASRHKLASVDVCLAITVAS